MALEYVPGGDLFSFLQDRQEGEHTGHGEAVTEPDAIIYSGELVCVVAAVAWLTKWSPQVLAIEHLHLHGIVYRDLKPEKYAPHRWVQVWVFRTDNCCSVLMDKNGHLCLTDFGLSKIISATSGEEKRDRLFSFVGTPDYLAPEVTYTCCVAISLSCRWMGDECR